MTCYTTHREDRVRHKFRESIQCIQWPARWQECQTHAVYIERHHAHDQLHDLVEVIHDSGCGEVLQRFVSCSCLTPWNKFMDVMSPYMDCTGWYGCCMWSVQSQWCYWCSQLDSLPSTALDFRVRMGSEGLWRLSLGSVYIFARLFCKCWICYCIQPDFTAVPAMSPGPFRFFLQTMSIREQKMFMITKAVQHDIDVNSRILKVRGHRSSLWKSIPLLYPKWTELYCWRGLFRFTCV